MDSSTLLVDDKYDGLRKQVHPPAWTNPAPEIAQVGLSEREAEEQGRPVETHRAPLAEVDRAPSDGQSDGMGKIHCRPDSERILGAAVVAADAGNLVAENVLAMPHDIGKSGIGSAIHPYPTLAEAVRKPVDDHRRSLLTPTVQWDRGARADLAALTSEGGG